MSFDLSRWLCRNSAVLAASLFVVLHPRRAGSTNIRLATAPPRFFCVSTTLALIVLSYPAHSLNPLPAPYEIVAGGVCGVQRDFGSKTCSEATNKGIAIIKSCNPDAVIVSQTCPHNADGNIVYQKVPGGSNFNMALFAYCDGDGWIAAANHDPVIGRHCPAGGSTLVTRLNLGPQQNPNPACLT